MHLVEQRRALFEECLPSRVLKGIRTCFATRFQAWVGPDMADLVWLPHLGLPKSNDLGIVFTHREDRGESIEPLLHRTGGLGAIVPELVDISRRGRRNGRPDRIEQADILAH